VVTEVYYARSFTARFRRNGKIMARADIHSQLDIAVHASYEWSDANTLVITENKNVPFGIRGFKL
jgi:hypothetical protein